MKSNVAGFGVRAFLRKWVDDVSRHLCQKMHADGVIGTKVMVLLCNEDMRPDLVFSAQPDTGTFTVW